MTSDLTLSSYVILGMIHNGSRTGYDVRRSVSLSLRYFWSVSPTQIYAELANLEQQGLLHAQDAPRGKRPRRTFELTDLGRYTLRAWLLSEAAGEFELRDLLQVKIFFADCLTAAEASRLIDNVRARSDRYLRFLHEEVQPAVERSRAQQDPFVFPVRIANLHIELHEFMLDWSARVQGELASTAAAPILPDPSGGADELDEQANEQITSSPFD